MFGPVKLARVLRNLRPTLRVRDAGGVTAEFLRANGIELVLWDVDGTLMSYHGQDVAPEFAAPIRKLFSAGPAHHAILSNCDEVRYARLGEIFPEVPVLRAYNTPKGAILRVLERGCDSHSPDEVRRLTTVGTTIRKPSARLVALARHHFDVAEPERIVVVGDQYLTDIASANMGGALSVRVPPVHPATFPVRLRFSQRLEQLLFMLRHPRSILDVSAVLNPPDDLTNASVKKS